MQKRIKFIKGANAKISEDAPVTVLDLNNKLIIKKSWRNPSNLKRFKRLENNRCIDIETGEIIEYKNNKFKSQKSIKYSMKKLHYLIEANFTASAGELFITLTYSKENKQTDINQARKDVRLFLRRLQTRFKNSKFAVIYKLEIHGCLLSWHIHLLLKDITGNVIFIPNDTITDIWKKGHTSTKSVTNSAGIASYMSKTTQLFDVPSNTLIYGYTRKYITKPKISKGKYGTVRKYIDDDYYKAHANTILVQDTYRNKYINVHQTETYLKKRK